MPSLDFTEILIEFAVLLVSLTVHEAAHAWSAERLGDPTARLLGRVSLNPAVHVDPIGTILFPLLAIATGVPVLGWAKPVPVDIRRLGRGRRDFVLVAAAGPVSNLLLAVAGAVVWRTGAVAMLGDGAANVVFFFVVTNVLLAVFNLIPVPPLDGGNVLSGLLPVGAALQFDRLRPYGFLLLYLLMFSGALRVLVSFPMGLILSWLI